MSNLLKISEAASLGMHTMTVLAGCPDRWISTHEIAEALDVSENHLSKVCQRLVKSGLIEAVRGPKGGLKLAKPADEITLIQVYEAIEGELKASKCLLGHPACSRNRCILGGLMDTVNTEVMRQFSETRLSQLVE
jgi:Rrf2 family protein